VHDALPQMQSRIATWRRVHISSKPLRAAAPGLESYEAGAKRREPDFLEYFHFARSKDLDSFRIAKIEHKVFFSSVYPSMQNQKSKIHLMILSARYRTDCGIVRPICFAVFRLITNSNFVGCS